MSIDLNQMEQALRTKLLTYPDIATTGSISMSATGTTYVRASGSFVTDGFFPGMETAGTGFSGANNDAVATVTIVTALTLTVNRTLTTEGAAAGKTLAVGLPANRSWENIEFEPDQGAPYIEEQFIPGPSAQVTVGPGGTWETRPQYSVLVHVPENTGSDALNEYVNALLVLFAPRTAMSLTNGDVLRVRTDTGPFAGQKLRRKPGWVVAPVTFPLWLHTVNP